MLCLWPITEIVWSGRLGFAVFMVKKLVPYCFSSNATQQNKCAYGQKYWQFVNYYPKKKDHCHSHKRKEISQLWLKEFLDHAILGLMTVTVVLSRFALVENSTKIVVEKNIPEISEQWMYFSSIELMTSYKRKG